MVFLVAYDIADPRRLRRVARLLEKRAVRLQYSVFAFRGTDTDLDKLLDAAAELIDPKLDVVQAWRLAPGLPLYGQVRGTASPFAPPSVVLGAGAPLVARLPPPAAQPLVPYEPEPKDARS